MNEPNPKDYEDPIVFALDMSDWRNQSREQHCSDNCPCGSELGIKGFSCDVCSKNVLCRCGEAIARLVRAQAFHEAGNIVSLAIGYSARYGVAVSPESLRDSLHNRGLAAENGEK